MTTRMIPMVHRIGTANTKPNIRQMMPTTIMASTYPDMPCNHTRTGSGGERHARDDLDVTWTPTRLPSTGHVDGARDRAPPGGLGVDGHVLTDGRDDAH